VYKVPGDTRNCFLFISKISVDKYESRGAVPHVPDTVVIPVLCVNGIFVPAARARGLKMSVVGIGTTSSHVRGRRMVMV
jgi:thymidine phosphorylase